MYNRKFVLAGIALASAGLIASNPQPSFAHGKNKHEQNVTVSVDGTGYHPASFNVKAGKPVHLTFVSKGAGCANQVAIPALKKTFSLEQGQKKEIVFTPKKGQTLAFACSMKMFKGKAVAK